VTVAGNTPAASRSRAFVELTKPRITGLLLITCVTAMVVAERGAPALGVTVFTALGLAMSSGGASALNHVFDRDNDAQMTRTSDRPIVQGTVGVLEGTLFGIGLMVVAFVLVAQTRNMFKGVLAFWGGAVYVLGYTMVLKRSTVQNIVIGGAAGSAPPLVGWAAVTGHLDPLAWALFAIVFLWTPPHFWALAILIRDDYARAGVPMLPVVRGVEATARQILAYAVVLTVASLSPVLFGLGPIYAAVAIGLGARFVQLSWRLWRASNAGVSPEDLRVGARTVFLYSMAYLGLLFLAAVVDALLW
jgi:protoheme IX farnesyltransferase